MGNPLLVLWNRIFAEPGELHREPTDASGVPELDDQPPSAGILLVLRRMRVPLIVIIVIFAVSVLGLTLIPGQDAQGQPRRMGIFESFYFMSYTATTIGFGELPYTFTDAQRMWVTFAIFMSVIGWAYGIGSLLALMQDRAFRRTLARRRFARQVAHLKEPFLILVGYGNATKRLARSLDRMGRRFVIVESNENRVAGVDLDSYRADTPTLLGDARDTGKLALAGLGHPHCEGVIALTGDDETNLDVTMTTTLLRPGLPVIARTSSREIAARMRSCGTPEVVNPLDRFGDHLRILLRSPSAYQLMMWLTSAPGTPLPRRHEPPPRGEWLVCGYGRFGRELTADLRAEGLDVTVLQGQVGDGQDPVDEEAVSRAARSAAAIVATTESDITNLWLVETARGANREIFTAAMQNRAGNAALFRAVGVDFALLPGELIAHEALARLASPALMGFLPEVPRHDEGWANRLVARLVERCGKGAPELWVVRLSPDDAPALAGRLAAGGLTIGDLMRSPSDRSRPLAAVPLTLVRDGAAEVAPEDGTVLLDGDELLLAGRTSARRELGETLEDPPTATYVVDARLEPSSWVWQRLSKKGKTS